MATCSYNGVSFTSLYRTHVSSRPIMDEAERTTVYVEHTLEVDGYITPNVTTGTTDTTLTAMRKALTAQGGALNFSDKGFGDLKVNVDANGVRDAKWGPHPEILEWIPLGGDGLGVCKVSWRVTTRIPECTGAIYTRGLLAWNYDETFEIDEAGYTVVHYSGYLEIPMTRRSADNRNLQDNVDRYREILEAPPTAGFTRRSATFRVSKDKRRLDFDIVNEELPTALPPGAAMVDGRYSVTSSLTDGKAFRHWTVNVDLTVTLPKGVERSHGMEIFLSVLSVRLETMRKHLGDPAARLFPQRLNIEEELFGRTSRFSWTGKYMGSTEQWIFLAGTSQIWRSLGLDHDRWITSLAPFRTHGVRGWAELVSAPQDDAIIDLCVPRDTPDVVGVIRPVRDGIFDPRPGENFDRDMFKGITAKNSWVGFDVALEYDERSGATRHKLLLPAGDSAARAPGQPDSLPPAPSVWGGNLGDDDSIRDQVGPGIAPAEGQGTRPSDPIQRPTTPTRILILSGFGVRIGYRVPAPRLVSVGGVQVTESRRRIKETSEAGLRGIPFYRTDWEITYILPAAPTGVIPFPANPMLGTDGADGATGKLTP